MRIIIVILLLFAASFTFGQINFYKQYSEEGYDFGQGILQMEDSSYVITGSSSSFGDYQSQAFLLHVDSLGNVLWSNNYGGMESDWGRRVLYKDGFGFFIAGYTNSIGNGAYDYYLVKTDVNGVEEWETSFGGSGWEKVHDAALTRDSGVIMVGESSSNLTNHKDIYIVRTNKTGDEVWSTTIGNDGDDWATTVKTYQDSTFLVAGSTYVTDSLHTRGFFMQFHEDGTLLWGDTIHFNGNVEINDFILSNDSIRAVGNYFHDGDSSNVMTFSYVITTESFFTLDTLNTGGHLTGEKIASYRDATFPFLVAYNIVSSQNFPIGPDLNVGYYLSGLWYAGAAALINHEGPDIAGQMISTSDGGAALVGYTSTDGMGGGNIFLCKFGVELNFPTILGVTAVNSFVSIEEFSEFEQTIIYPNPANDVFTIETQSNEAMSLVIYDVVGKSILVKAFQGTEVVDVSMLHSGAYLVEIQLGNKLIGTKRLVIQ